VFKEASALRYHQIHHPQALEESSLQQQQHHVYSSPVLNGLAGSFLNSYQHLNGFSSQLGMVHIFLRKARSVPDPKLLITDRDQDPDLQN